MLRRSKENCSDHDDLGNEYDSSKDYMSEDNTDYYSEGEDINIDIMYL